MASGSPALSPSVDTPRAWIRLHEAPFEGEWIGLSHDYASHLPCGLAELAWVRLWVCLSAPRDSRLAQAVIDEAWRLYYAGTQDPLPLAFD